MTNADEYRDVLQQLVSTELSLKQTTNKRNSLYEKLGSVIRSDPNGGIYESEDGESLLYIVEVDGETYQVIANYTTIESVRSDGKTALYELQIEDVSICKVSKVF